MDHQMTLEQAVNLLRKEYAHAVQINTAHPGAIRFPVAWSLYAVWKMVDHDESPFQPNLVPIVRCKDCVNWVPETGGDPDSDGGTCKCWSCPCDGQLTMAHFWCEFGERDEDR